MLPFVRIRERLYDVAASLYWASESGANVDLRELCDAYDSSAPEPVTTRQNKSLEVSKMAVSTSGSTTTTGSSMQALGLLKLPTSFANPLAFPARYGARRYDADRVHPFAAR